MVSLLFTPARLPGLSAGILLLCLWFCTGQAVAQTSVTPDMQAVPMLKQAPSVTPLVWKNIETGLDLAQLTHQANDSLDIFILRFEPKLFDFSLHSSTWDNTPPLSIGGWAQSLDLSAAINASMYLQDGQTSTGYMRRGEVHNNARIAGKFGSFFVAAPRRSGLPQAAVLDRTVDDWQALLPEYDIVVQNFRLLGPDGAQLWPETGPAHSIAAVGQDKAGRILFMHCLPAVTVHRFVDALLAHPELELSSAMYVEGGTQATMVLRHDQGNIVWVGQHPTAFLRLGAVLPLLPNIIGVKRR